MLHQIQHQAVLHQMLVSQRGTSCWEFSFLSLYLIPSFGFQSPDCCCGICCSCGPTQVLRTARGLLQLFGAQQFIQRHSPVHPHGNMPTKRIWSLTSRSMQPSCSVRVPKNTFCITFASWHFEESTGKMSCSIFRTLPVHKTTLTIWNPLLTLVVSQEHTFASGKIMQELFVCSLRYQLPLQLKGWWLTIAEGSSITVIAARKYLLVIFRGVKWSHTDPSWFSAVNLLAEIFNSSPNTVFLHNWI